MIEWISVEDKLPEKAGWYLVYAPAYWGGSSSSKECINGVLFSKWNGKSWSIEKGYHNRPNIVLKWTHILEP